MSRVLQYDSVGAVWRATVDENHPPLFFAILWTTLRVMGVSEAAARLPSALASVSDLAWLFVLARRLSMSKRAAAAAVMLLALAPVSVWYAQEARMYALVATAALLFAIGLTFTSSSGALLAAAALTAGLYIDFTMVPLSAVLTCLWFIRWRHTGGQSLHLVMVVILETVSWLAFQPRWSHLGDVFRRIDTVPLLVNLRKWFGLQFSPGGPAIVMMILMAAFAAAAAAATLRWLRHPRFTFWFGWLVWAGFVACTAGMMAPRGYSAKQFLATGWPFVVLAVAWTLTDGMAATSKATSLSRLRLPLAVGVSLIAAIVTVNTQRADWRGVVAYLNQRASRTHAVWLDPSWNSVPYEYYRPRIAPTPNPLETPDETGQYEPGHAVCLVAQRYGGSPPTSPTEAWLDSRLRLVDAVPFARLEVRCYAE